WNRASHAPTPRVSSAAAQNHGAQRAAKRSKYGGEPRRWNQRITGFMGWITSLAFGAGGPGPAGRAVQGIFPDWPPKGQAGRMDTMSTPGASGAAGRFGTQAMVRPVRPFCLDRAQCAGFQRWAMRIAAAAASGASTAEATSPAAISSSAPLAYRPCSVAATLPAPNTSTG